MTVNERLINAFELYKIEDIASIITSFEVKRIPVTQVYLPVKAPNVSFNGSALYFFIQAPHMHEGFSQLLT